MAETWAETEATYASYLLTTGHSDQTTRSYVANLRIFARFCALRAIDPATAGRPVLEAYVTAEFTRISRNTVALRLACLRAFYGFCRDRLGRQDDPTRGLIVKREETAPRPPYTEADIAALLAACRNARDRAMIIVALECGLRVSELVGLRAGDVDLARGLMLVRGKGAKQRWVGLGPRPSAALRPFLCGSGGVLWRMKDGWPLTVRRAKRNMGEIARRAGVRAHWHRFRTTFAHRFIDATRDADALQTILGHVSADTTRRYTAFHAQERALDAMRRLA